MNLSMTIAPHRQDHTASPGQAAHVGHALFAVVPSPSIPHTAPDALLHFGALLRDAALLSIPAAPSDGTDVQLTDSEPGEAPDAGVDAADTLATNVQASPVQATEVRETTSLHLLHGTELVAQGKAPSMVHSEPAFAATLVASEAIALRQAVAPASMHGPIVQADTTPLLASQTAVPLEVAPALAAASSTSDFGSARPENALLQLASQSMNSAAATLAVLAGEPAATNVADRHGHVARQPLEVLLGERLQIQIARRSEHAVVRLDPPSMGTIEIVIRQEGAHLQVQLRASNGEVARQLQVIGETLRQDLVQRQQGDVSVHVWDSSREGERQRQRVPLPWQDEPGRALNEDGEERASFAMSTAIE